MDHHFVFRVKAVTPGANQLHVVMSRMNCLPVYKVPQVHFGSQLSQTFPEETHYKEAREFIERMGKDEVVGVFITKHKQDQAQLEEYDSDQQEFEENLNKFLEGSRLGKVPDNDEANRKSKEPVEKEMQETSAENLKAVGAAATAEGEVNHTEAMTFAEKYRAVQETASTDERIRYLRYLNLQDAIKCYEKYKQNVDPPSDDELYTNVPKSLNLRTTISSWGRRCPVAFAHGLLLRGRSKYVARYHDKYYFLSTKKALKKFVIDPDRYLFPAFPISTCNVLVTGHPICGKTFVAEAIASYYNAVVVDFTSLRREARLYKYKAKLKLLDDITRSESLKYVNDVGVDVYVNDEFERHEDFIDWFVMAFRLMYFRAYICPPENIMTLPRKHGCVLPKKIKRAMSDIEELKPTNVFSRFFKHIAFHSTEEEQNTKEIYIQIIKNITDKVVSTEPATFPYPPGENDKEKIRNARRLFLVHKIPYFSSESILKKYLQNPLRILRFCPKVLKPHINPYHLDPHHPVVSSFAMEVWKNIDKSPKELAVHEEINILSQAIFEIEHKAKVNNLINYGGWVIDGVSLNSYLWQGLWERGLSSTFVVYLQDPDMESFSIKVNNKRYVEQEERFTAIEKTLDELDFKKSHQETEEEVLKETCKTNSMFSGIQLQNYEDLVSSDSEDEYSIDVKRKLIYSHDSIEQFIALDSITLKSASHKREKSMVSKISFSFVPDTGYQDANRHSRITTNSHLSNRSSTESRDSDELNKSVRLAEKYRPSLAAGSMRKKGDSRDMIDTGENPLSPTEYFHPECQFLKMNFTKKKHKLSDISLLPKLIFEKHIYNPRECNYKLPEVTELYNELADWNSEIKSKIFKHFQDQRLIMDELRNDVIQSGLMKSNMYYRRYVGRTDPIKYITDFYDVIDGPGAVHRTKSPLTSTFFTDHPEEVEEHPGEHEGEGEQPQPPAAEKTDKSVKETMESWALMGKFHDKAIELHELWTDQLQTVQTPLPYKTGITHTKPIIQKKLYWCVVHLREGMTVRALNLLTYLHKEYPICSRLCLQKFRRWPYYYTNIEEPYRYISPLKISVLGLPGSGSNKVAQVIADYLGLTYMNFFDKFNEKLLLPGHYPTGPYYEQPKLLTRQFLPPNINHTLSTMHYNTIMNAYLNHKRRMPLKHWVHFYLPDFKQGGFIYHQMPYSIHDFILMHGLNVMPDIIINIKRKRMLCRKRLENKILEMWKRRTRELNKARLISDQETRVYWKALYLLNFWKYLRILVDFFQDLKRLNERLKDVPVPEVAGEEEVNTGSKVELVEVEATEPLFMSVLGSMKVKKIFYMPHTLRSTKRVKYSIKYIQKPQRDDTTMSEEEDTTSDSRQSWGDSIDNSFSFREPFQNYDEFIPTPVDEETALALYRRETLAEKLRKKVEVKGKPVQQSILSGSRKIKSLNIQEDHRTSEDEIKQDSFASLKRIQGTCKLVTKSLLGHSTHVLNPDEMQRFRKSLIGIQMLKSKVKNKYLHLLEIDASCIFKRLKALLKKAMHFDPHFNETGMSAALLYIADDEDPNKVQVLDLEGVSHLTDLKEEVDKLFADRTLDHRITESLTLKGIQAELVNRFPVLNEFRNRKFMPSDGERLLGLIEKYRDISRFTPYVITYMNNKYPKPMLLGLLKNEVHKDEFKEILARTLKKEFLQIKRMRNYSKLFGNAWLDVKPGRRSMKTIMKTLLNYRMPHGETVYNVDFKYVEQYIDNGTFYLSKFGRRCPVECFEKNLLYHNDLLPSKPIVVAHKRYVYFLSSPEAKVKFTENPLKYIKHSQYCINIPISIMIIGPELSRRIKVAKYFEEKYNFEIVTVDIAMRFLFRNFPNSSLGNLIYEYLRRGLGIPIILVYQAVDLYISTCGRCTSYGWVFVGAPGTHESLCVLKELGLIPHLLLVVDLTDKTAYYNSIERKKDGKLKNGNIDLKFLRHIDKNVAEKNFKVWRCKEIQTRIANTCKQAVSFYIAKGNFYPLYSAIMLEMAMDKLYNALKASHYFRYYSAEVASPISTFNRIDRLSFTLSSSDLHDHCALCWECEGILVKSPDVGINDNVFQVNNWSYWFCPWHKNQMYVVPPNLNLYDSAKPLAMLPFRINRPVVKKILDFPYCITCYKNDSDKVKSMNGERYVPGNKKCIFTCGGRVLSTCREECLAKFYKRANHYMTAIAGFYEILECEDLDENFQLDQAVEVPKRFWPPAMKYPTWFVLTKDLQVPKLPQVDEIIEYNPMSISENSIIEFEELPLEPSTVRSEESIIWRPEISIVNSGSLEMIMLFEENKLNPPANKEEDALEIEKEMNSFKYVDDYRELDDYSFTHALKYFNHLYNNKGDMNPAELKDWKDEMAQEVSKFNMTSSQEEMLWNFILKLKEQHEKKEEEVAVCTEEMEITIHQISSSEYLPSSLSDEFKKIDLAESEHFEGASYYLNEESNFKLDPYSAYEDASEASCIKLQAEFTSQATESEWYSGRQSEEEASEFASTVVSTIGGFQSEIPSVTEDIIEEDFVPTTVSTFDSNFNKRYNENYFIKKYQGEGKSYPYKHFYGGEYAGEGRIRLPPKVVDTFFIEPEESFEEFFPYLGKCEYKFTSGMSLDTVPYSDKDKPITISEEKSYAIDFPKSPTSTTMGETFKVNVFASDQMYIKYITQTDLEDEPNLCLDVQNTIEQMKEIREVYNEEKVKNQNLAYLAETISDIVCNNNSTTAKNKLYQKLFNLGQVLHINVNHDQFPRSLNYDRKTQTFFNMRSNPFLGMGVLAPYFLGPGLKALCPLCAFSSITSKTKYESALTVTPFCCFTEFEIANNLNETIDHYNELDIEPEYKPSISYDSLNPNSSKNLFDQIDEIYEEIEVFDFECKDEEEEMEEEEWLYPNEVLYENEEWENCEEESLDLFGTNGQRTEEGDEDMICHKKWYEKVTFKPKLVKGYPWYYFDCGEEMEEEENVREHLSLHSFKKSVHNRPVSANEGGPTIDVIETVDVKTQLTQCSSDSDVVEAREQMKKMKQIALMKYCVQKAERRVTILDEYNNIHYYSPESYEIMEEYLELSEADLHLLEDEDEGSSVDENIEMCELLQSLQVKRKTYEDDGGRASILYMVKTMLERFIFNRSMLDMIQDPFDVTTFSVDSQYYDNIVDPGLIPHWLEKYHEETHILPDAIELLTLLKDDVYAEYIIEILRNWVKSYAYGSYNLHHFFDLLKATKCRKNEYNILGYKCLDKPLKNSSIWDTILTLERAKMPLDRITTNAAMDALHRSRFMKDQVMAMKKRFLIDIIRKKIRDLKMKWTRRMIQHKSAWQKKNEFTKLVSEEGKEAAYKSVYGGEKEKKRKKKRKSGMRMSDMTRAEFLKKIKKPKGKKESLFEKDLREFLTTLAYDLPPGERSPEMDIQERILDIYMKRHPKFYWMDSLDIPPKMTDAFFSTCEPDELPHPYNEPY
ncbi:uncharacterized protein LOC106668320 [Cimex lectularius]|uniref:Uncharacterized protein n=1 Tax=Cimex lectularius TaxID=79782 RepID=A0A8I6RX68_CIMLE|nr:uncharacterized protein LOC106668320 [Cimex lectularius]